MSTTAEVLEKLRGLDGPTLLALVDAFPEERDGVDAVLCGDKKIRLEDAIKLLVDRHGNSRAIADKSVVTANVCDPNRAYRLDRPADDYDFFAVTLELWQRRYGQDPGLDAKVFMERIRALKARVADDRQIRNLVGPEAAPCFPLILPRVPLQEVEGSEELKQPDYGKLLENFLLPAVNTSYESAYPGQNFINNCEGALAGQVTIIEPRHAKLYTDLVNGPIVGILFPASLHGFSPLAQRQMVTLFPDDFSLQGPLDMSVAETLYPKCLSRDGNTPLKDCSAVHLRQAPDYSLYFYAGGDQLLLDCRGRLGGAYDCYSGGLLLRG